MSTPNFARRRPPTAVVDQAPRALTDHGEPRRPRPYPHRLSVDVDDDTYRTLRLLAVQENCRLIDLVRVAIAREIEAHRPAGL